MPEIKAQCTLPPEHSPGTQALPRCICHFGDHLAWRAEWKLTVSGLTEAETNGKDRKQLVCVCQEVTFIDSSYDSHGDICDVMKRQIVEVFALDAKGSSQTDQHGAATEPVGVDCNARCRLRSEVSVDCWLVTFPTGNAPTRTGFSTRSSSANSRMHHSGPTLAHDADRRPPMNWVHRSVRLQYSYVAEVIHCGAPGFMKNTIVDDDVVVPAFVDVREPPDGAMVENRPFRWAGHSHYVNDLRPMERTFELSESVPRVRAASELPTVVLEASGRSVGAWRVLGDAWALRRLGRAPVRVVAADRRSRMIDAERDR